MCHNFVNFLLTCFSRFFCNSYDEYAVKNITPFVLKYSSHFHFRCLKIQFTFLYLALHFFVMSRKTVSPSFICFLNCCFLFVYSTQVLQLIRFHQLVSIFSPKIIFSHTTFIQIKQKKKSLLSLLNSTYLNCHKKIVLGTISWDEGSNCQRYTYLAI